WRQGRSGRWQKVRERGGIAPRQGEGRSQGGCQGEPQRQGGRGHGGHRQGRLPAPGGEDLRAQGQGGGAGGPGRSRDHGGLGQDGIRQKRRHRDQGRQDRDHRRRRCGDQGLQNHGELMAEPGTQTVDPQAGVREANAVLNRVLARLGELAEPDIDRAGAGQALVAAIRALYDALAPTASEGKRADAVTDAMRQLSAGLALLQERPLQSTEATLVLHETARALALLFPVQKQLQEVALANFQNRKAMRMDPAGRVGTGAGVLYQWSRAKLLLHAIDRLTVGPTFAPAPQAPPPEPEEPDDAPPGFTMDELKAMAAAIQQGGPLPGSEPEPEAEEAPSEPPAPLTLPVPEQPLPDDLLATHLAVLATLYEQRRFEQGDPGTPWIRLAATEQRIYERVDAVAWLGEDVVARLAEALEGVDGAPAGFAAALPLCAISGVGAVDAVFRALEALPEAAHPGVLEALRLSPHPEVSARLVGLLRVEAPGSVRAGAVTIAAERGLLQEHAVTARLADPD